MTSLEQCAGPRTHQKVCTENKCTPHKRSTERLGRCSDGRVEYGWESPTVTLGRHEWWNRPVDEVETSFQALPVSGLLLDRVQISE